MARLHLSHALLLCGAIAFASLARAGESPDGWGDPDDHDGWHDGDGHDGWDGGHDDGHDHDLPPPDGADHVRQKLSAKFDVDESVITRLRNRGLGYGEIDHALTLASGMEDGLNRNNVRQVLEMREDGMGWGQIAHELGTTMGAAKRDFRASPPPSDDTPPKPPSDGPGMQPRPPSEGSRMHARSPSDGTGMQPTSVSRPGRSSFAKGSRASAGRFGGKGLASSGSRSGGRISGASAGRANGHAFGRASSSHGSGSRGGGGKAKGRK